MNYGVILPLTLILSAAWRASAELTPVLVTSSTSLRLTWSLDSSAISVILQSASTYTFGNVSVAVSSTSNVFIAWEQALPDGSDTDVLAQKFSPTGAPLWGPHGIIVNNFRGHQRKPSLVPLRNGGAAVAWQSDSAGPHNNNVWAQLIRSNGQLLWQTPAPVCTAPGNQLNPVIALDADSGIVVAWEDYRRGNADIYAQRLDFDGAPLAPEDGVPLDDAPGDQRNPRFLTSPDGALSLLWDDYRPSFAAPVQVKSDLSQLPIPEPSALLSLLLLLLSRHLSRSSPNH